MQMSGMNSFGAGRLQQSFKLQNRALCRFSPQKGRCPCPRGWPVISVTSRTLACGTGEEPLCSQVQGVGRGMGLLVFSKHQQIKPWVGKGPGAWSASGQQKRMGRDRCRGRQRRVQPRQALAVEIPGACWKREGTSPPTLCGRGPKLGERRLLVLRCVSRAGQGEGLHGGQVGQCLGEFRHCPWSLRSTKCCRIPGHWACLVFSW